jgi:hypothetical protein
MYQKKWKFHIRQSIDIFLFGGICRCPTLDPISDFYWTCSLYIVLHMYEHRLDMCTFEFPSFPFTAGYRLVGWGY